tara:strand:+ start:691 stop:1107 length:417 start_codon:yes stop_codon:yes gene_type:complete
MAKELPAEDHVHLLKAEIEIYKLRVTRLNSEIQQYFNSSQLRNVFSRIMTLAAYENKGLTIADIVAQTYSSRQTVSKMISQCRTLGYIELIEDDNYLKRYRATPELVKAQKIYNELRHKVAREIYGKADVRKRLRMED